MTQNLINGALLSCSFGLSPASLIIAPINRVNITQQAAGNIQDNIAMLNIPPFGLCTSLSNPLVASATAVASGVLTPQPCIPMTNAPWILGSTSVKIAGIPVLHKSCQLMCQWGGVIAPEVSGQVTVESA